MKTFLLQDLDDTGRQVWLGSRDRLKKVLDGVTSLVILAAGPGAEDRWLVTNCEGSLDSLRAASAVLNAYLAAADKKKPAQESEAAPAQPAPAPAAESNLDRMETPE